MFCNALNRVCVSSHPALQAAAVATVRRRKIGSIFLTQPKEQQGAQEILKKAYNISVSRLSPQLSPKLRFFISHAKFHSSFSEF
jgi:hypothetical protein